MSAHDHEEPICSERSDAISLLISGRGRDLGGFSVRRVLPATECRTIGPFIFFDEMGPADFPPGKGIDVRPHPHIGLSTVTFLFDGQIMHRDSLGFVQPIEPGAVNLMTAGRGIVHSERTAPERRASGQRLHGIQTWMALPEALQEIDPAFEHHPAGSLPTIETPGAHTTVIIGTAFGATSPVQAHARTLYLFHALDAGARLTLPSAQERGLYLVDGRVRIGECTLEPGVMAVLNDPDVEVVADTDARLLLVGGEPIGPRELYWNFVHSSAARIEQAKAEWAAGGFDRVPGDEEFIPLPD